MNFFFGIKNEEFTSNIQIPIFQNRKPNPIKISLFKGYVKNNAWKFEQLKNNKINNDFFEIKENEISNDDIFFLANQNDFNSFKENKLVNFNKFTNTSPAFRCNFRIDLINGGFSSYQSEYPYSMVIKKGSILSSVNSIANTEAEKNYVFVKNIYEEPIKKKFNVYLIDIKNRKIEEKIEMETNYTNSFQLKKSLIKPEIFLITKDYLGVPMYVSVHKKHVSFEHTHPPHEYILSQNKFKIIKNLKDEINEIIN